MLIHQLADGRKTFPDFREKAPLGHKPGNPQPANHLAVIVVGTPSPGSQPVGNSRFHGANDPRRDSGLALGY